MRENTEEKKENVNTRGYKGSISYDGLWKLLEKKGLKKQSLRGEPYNISPTIVNRLAHNTNVAVDTIMFLCEKLNCNVGDILEYIPPVDTKN